MMYSNSMIVCVKANEKILREFGDIVKLPFGTEYSILIKNLKDVRAKVNVYVDGVDVFNGKTLIVNPKSSSEITRFVNDLSQGNSFKFIERTSKIEQNRGIEMEDGLIRVSFSFETAPLYLSGNIGSPTLYRKGSPQKLYKSANYSVDITPQAVALNQVNDIGITVPGSINNQEFKMSTDFFSTGSTETMILKLVGFTDNGTLVDNPVTVKTKQVCQTCGHKNKMTSKFCTECGTSLQII